jgi:hypothetical protein
MDYPAVDMPQVFHVDDCMILEPAPPEKAADFEIIRGPTSAIRLRTSPCPSTSTAR